MRMFFAILFVVIIVTLALSISKPSDEDHEKGFMWAMVGGLIVLAILGGAGLVNLR